MKQNSSIYQISIIRSGSTLVYQILCDLFPNRKVVKQHHFPKIPHLDFPVVSTYRDPRDILVSTWRTFILSRNGKSIRNIMTKKDIDDTVKFLDPYIINFNKGKERFSESVLWLKYEDFYKDTDVIFNAMEKYFSTTIPNKKRENIKANCSIDKNRKRSKSFKNFVEYDYLKTEIHGDHIFKGEIGGWKAVVPDDLHDMVNDKFKNDLKLWGYEM